jgi:hypothetical protein
VAATVTNAYLADLSRSRGFREAVFVAVAQPCRQFIAKLDPIVAFAIGDEMLDRLAGRMAKDMIGDHPLDAIARTELELCIKATAREWLQ